VLPRGAQLLCARQQAALAAMMQLELPHVNVLTKMDLLNEKRADVEQCVASFVWMRVAGRPLTGGLVGSCTPMPTSLHVNCSTQWPVATGGSMKRSRRWCVRAHDV
jgi:hypothetical protein